ncbi:MAG: DEAD/DEAH box helicase family protein [Legionella sp.]|nr:DEAD/DEAH box helicase family protein [Legionella sp.]
MHLSKDSKANLLAKANQVYQSYVALDFFKTKKLHNNTSLLEICTDAIKENKLEQDITINGTACELKITVDAQNNYNISFSRPVDFTNNQAITKKITEYSDSEALNLLTKQNFCLHQTGNNQFAVSNQIDDAGNAIGGPGKIDLYRSHLVTLHQIIEKIDREEDVTNLLVALATGTGKTYVQALWMYILGLSGKTGVFGIPDKLIPQFQDDLKRLLPDAFVDDISILRKDASNEKLKTGTITLASSEELLDKHYQSLLDTDPDTTFLSFDEQHLLMTFERRRVRLIELSKKILTMFLTATPQPETYELAGNRPVA